VLIEQDEVVHHRHHRALGHNGPSWIDMLAGLSIMYCLRMPPDFWASAAALST